MDWPDPDTLVISEKISALNRVLNSREPLPPAQVQAYVSALVGRAVFTHEMAHPEDLQEEILRGYTADPPEIYRRYRRHWPDKPFVFAHTMLLDQQAVARDMGGGVIVETLDEAIQIAEQGELQPIIVYVGNILEK